MRHAVTYFDGGSSTPPGTKKRNVLKVSWGIVSHMDDQTVESNGVVIKKKEDIGCGTHEWVALFESIFLVSHRGYQPHECSFYTDDQFISHAPTYLHESNYLPSSRDKVIQVVATITKKFYSGNEEVFNLVLRFLAGSRMHWVKGHHMTTYNCRADYLVRQARSESPLIPYDRWLAEFCVNGGDRGRNVGSAFINANCCHFRNMM